MSVLVADSWSRTVFVWGIIIIVGSVFTYFYPTPVDTVFMAWGALALLGIAVSSYLADWGMKSNVAIQFFWIVSIGGLFTLDALAVYKHVFPIVLLYNLFLEWSVLCSIGYLFTGFLTRWRGLFAAGIFTLFLIPVFQMPAMTAYTPLIFGIPHGFLLIVLALT